MNVSRAGVPNVQLELDKTVFHELLHADERFRHDDDFVSAAAQAGKLQMADRTYACETMCFDKNADACTCIRCLSPHYSEVLNKKVCTQCEAKFGPTTACAKRYETGTDGQPHAVASAVAAWCPGLKRFCDTKAECDAECNPVGQGCTPVRATCDDRCN